MKKFLWVEDDIETVLDSIENLKLFNQVLNIEDYSELENLRNSDIERRIKFLRKNGIFIEQDFYKACKRIFVDKFDKIILDVSFPSPPDNQINSEVINKARQIFANSSSNKKKEVVEKFETIFDHIIEKKEYSGLLLFIIICRYYDKEKNISNIAEKVCVFTGNDKIFDDFENLIDQQVSNRRLSELEVGAYIENVKERFWQKTDEDFMRLKNFIEFDEYVKILKEKISDKTARLYIDLEKEITSSKDLEIIKSLGSLRHLLQNILEKIAEHPDVHKDYYDKLKKQKVEIFRKNKNLRVRPFITWLVYYSNGFKANSIIKNFLSAIQGIGSDFGPHDKLEDTEDLAKRKSENSGYQPTANTVTSLFYALKDIILWFDKIVQ